MSRSKKLGNFQGRVVLIWWIQRASGSMCDLVFHPTLRDDTQASHTVPSGCIFVGKKTSCLSSNRIHHPQIYHCNIWMDGLWHCFKNIESLFHLLQTCGRFISPFLGKSPRVCCEAQISKLEEAPQRGILPPWQWLVSSTGKGTIFQPWSVIFMIFFLCPSWISLASLLTNPMVGEPATMGMLSL